jgi:hypothetical protein
MHTVLEPEAKPATKLGRRKLEEPSRAQQVLFGEVDRTGPGAAVTAPGAFKSEPVCLLKIGLSHEVFLSKTVTKRTEGG